LVRNALEACVNVVPIASATVSFGMGLTEQKSRASTLALLRYNRFKVWAWNAPTPNALRAVEGALAC